MSDTLSLKLLKVDNWGIFFLQRLQESFSKSNFCDLTLKFSGEAKLKVHRLVLNTCTEYFLGLEKQGNNEPNCLQLPNELHPDVVLPIINFMYTGRLEFKEELQDQLYTTAKEMKMTILTRLLDAQTVPVPPVSKSQNRRLAPPITYNLQGKKVIPKMVDPDLPETLPGRKLPIWKRRSAPPTVPTVNESVHTEELECTTREEPPRPTRFEWPEEEEGEELGSFSGAFDSISYDSKPLQRPKDPAVAMPQPVRTSTPIPLGSPVKANVSFEELRKTVIHKRPANQPPTEASGAKKGKVVDIQEVKEYLQEQELRKNLVDTEEEGGNEDDDFDDSVPVADLDDEEEEEKEMASAEESLTVTENVSHVEVVDPIPSPLHQSESGSSMLESSIGQPQKSILKSRISRDLPDTPSKRVRFSLEAESQEGKENDEKPLLVQEHKEVTQVHPQTECSLSCGSSNSNNLSNHAKIISEVLKKYPHLVKDNKNIKLKIMQRGGHSRLSVTPVEGDNSKVVRSKVSYVVVKSNDANKGKVVLKRGALTEPLSEFVNPEGQKPPSGAENTTGPWLCHSCGTNEEPINFETYYSYRKHLQDVHMEKIDARICEHCGHKASKRNLLLYHLYTRHGVPPPRNCQFPKCDQCDYVALSESLLIKHRNNHSNSRDFVCKVCNASFKSNGALQGHIQANLHGDPTKKKYECPYCRKPFVRNINLKAHIRSSHKEIARQLDGDDENLPEGKKKKSRPRILDSGSTVLHIQGSGSSAEEGSHPEHTVLVLQSGEKVLATSGMLQAPSLVPSSEAEALSNVASGIAASLGLTDSVTDVTENGNQGQRQENAGNSCSAFVIHDVSHSHVHEYIVPDIISGDIEVAHTYSGQLAELEHYGGEETSTCALDSNTGQLTAVSTANGTTIMDIAKQIPVLLADPNAQLHGNDFSGQRLTLVKDGVAYGVLVSQASDTIGSTVISRAESECSSTMHVDLNSAIPKLEKELPNNQGGISNDQASSAYDGMPPILMREVPLDATAPTGTSTVVLVTLPPSSEMGMQVAMREADFEEAVKCFVLAQDGTTMTNAPHITLMNAIPQEEIPRENPEKVMGSTGKIGRIGILKKKSHDHSRVIRNAPATIPMVTGGAFSSKSSTPSQSQQIGILLPVDTMQKPQTTSVQQPNQIVHINDKQTVLMNPDGTSSDATLVHANIINHPPPSLTQEHFVDQTQTPCKDVAQFDNAAKILINTPLPMQVDEVGVTAVNNSSPDEGKENKSVTHSSVTSGVMNSQERNYIKAQKSLNNSSIQEEESFVLRLELTSEEEIHSLSQTLPMSNEEVDQPRISTLAVKQEQMGTQKVLISLDVPGSSESIGNKVEILSENVILQETLPKMDSPISVERRLSEENSNIISVTSKEYQTPIDTHDARSQKNVEESGQVVCSDRSLEQEIKKKQNPSVMQEKNYVEEKSLLAPYSDKPTEISYNDPAKPFMKADTSTNLDGVHKSGVGTSDVIKLPENLIKDDIKPTKPKDFATSDNKSLMTPKVLSRSYTLVSGDSKTLDSTEVKVQKNTNPEIPQSGDLTVKEPNMHESLVNITPQPLSATVCLDDKLNPTVCVQNDKVT